MQKERISWIDIAKGIGIILVIYGHELTEDGFRYLIYSFHMPLFFFLSGVVFHVKNYEHFLPFFKKALKGVLFPYYFFAVVTFFIWLILFGLQRVSWDLLFQQICGIVYGSSTQFMLRFNNVLWFLPCLFITRIGFGLITKVTTRKKFLIAFLFFLSVFGYVFSRIFPGLKLPFGIEIAFTAIVFFGAGYLWNGHNQKLQNMLQKKALILLLIFILLCIVFAYLNFSHSHLQVDMRLNRLHNYFYTYLAAFSGIFACITVSVILKKNHILEYLGKHSLILFVWHLVLFSYFTHFLELFFTDRQILKARDLYLAPIFTILSIGIILSANFLWIKMKKSFV